MSDLIDFIYDDNTLKTPTTGALQEKAIVCPKNDTTDVVNAKILSLIEGEGKIYLSKDEALPVGKETSKTELLLSRTMSKNTIASLKIGQENCILEAIVYRKWISKSIPDMKELAFCCILIDKEMAGSNGSNQSISLAPKHQSHVEVEKAQRNGDFALDSLSKLAQAVTS
ncbi:DNA helicase [Tanacetum coccineum]